MDDLGSSKVAIIAVNYNTYESLRQYLYSIELSLENVQMIVDIYIADNSSQRELLDLSLFELNIRMINLNNLGYLGGAFNILNNFIDINDYDYIIISNVDVLLADDFFASLLRQRNNSIGWIAPSIFSQEENRDRNPKIIYRYSKRKLKILYYMYKIPILHWLYIKTLYRRKKFSKVSSSMDIYAGHGSFMIFTSEFLKNNLPMTYPVFLFGEELFFAELVLKNNMKVRYIPEIKVLDKEHISTSKMKKSFYYKCNRDAIKYILNTFYE